MVWKAAAQTRFRVFKHENGIAVKVIACFQPLQNCQVTRKELPFCLLRTPFLDLCNNCFGWFAVGRVLPSSPQARDVASLFSGFLLNNIPVKAFSQLQFD